MYHQNLLILQRVEEARKRDDNLAEARCKRLTLANWQCSALSVSISSGCSDLVGWLTDWRKLSSTPLKVNLFMVCRLLNPLALLYANLTTNTHKHEGAMRNFYRESEKKMKRFTGLWGLLLSLSFYQPGFPRGDNGSRQPLPPLPPPFPQYVRTK